MSIETNRPVPAMVSSGVAAGLALCGAAAVVAYAWVSEDAFITFRYVANMLDGYGPVFNVGERVQGFTHPLWFLLLAAGCSIVRDPILVSAALGAALTFATIYLIGTALFRVEGVGRAQAASGTAIFAALSVASDPWLAFQTGGLENPLSHLLIAMITVELGLRDLERPFRLTLLLALLCLSRPDLALMALPLSALLLSRARGARTLLLSGAAALPLLGWTLFAWLYYGNPIPNPAYAKLGIFPDWRYAVGQGIGYVADWIVHDPVSAAGCALFLGLGLRCARTLAHYAWAAGVALYLLWIVWIGGDFMRGRLLLPVFTASLVFGLVLANARPWPWASLLTPVRLLPAGALLIPLAMIQLHQRGDPGDIRGIANERSYYPGYRLGPYLRSGRLENPYLDLSFADDLRGYALRHGAISIHARNPGTLGFLSGPEVSIVDTLGLTDAFIARLPRTLLLDPAPRPGHPDKVIPLSYLAGRGDISLLPGWERAVRAGDSDLTSRARRFASSNALWVPDGPYGRIVREWPERTPSTRAD